MKTRQIRIRLAVVAIALYASASQPMRSGVNRWTSTGPEADVSRVVIDPVDPAVVYAATRKGIFKSSNGGLSWSDPSNGKLEGVNVHSLAIDPLTPSSILVGTGSGILKSTDAGATWSDSLAAGAIYNLLFGSRSSTIYAADFDDVSYYPAPSAVYKSADDGTTWTRNAVGFSIVPGTLVGDPTAPSTLYAAAYDFGGVYKSVDAGSTWRSGFGFQGPFVSAVAIAPQDPSRIYAVGRYFYKSVDAGSTWSVSSSALLGDAYVNALAIDPLDSNTLYAGTGRGVFRSTDGGANWREFNSGSTGFRVSSLAIDRTGTRLHASSFNGGVFDYQISSGALDVSVGSDNKTRLLFADPDGRLVIRSVGSGSSTSAGPYGPFGGWDSRAVADGSDGLTRVLWNNVDGAAALWLAGPAGNQASYRYGPFAGWTAVDVAASSPGATHLLWTDTLGRAAVWRIENTGHVSTGATYGPYSGWTAVAISDGADGRTRILWSRSDGSAALWFLGSEGIVASPRFGPVSGWRAADIAVGADGSTHILWSDRDGRIAFWRVDAAGKPTGLGPVYPPPPAHAVNRIAAGPDGLTRVLWANPSGAAFLWIMSADDVFRESIDLAPGVGAGIAGRGPGPLAVPPGPTPGFP